MTHKYVDMAVPYVAQVHALFMKWWPLPVLVCSHGSSICSTGNCFVREVVAITCIMYKSLCFFLAACDWGGTATTRQPALHQESCGRVLPCGGSERLPCCYAGTVFALPLSVTLIIAGCRWFHVPLYSWALVRNNNGWKCCWKLWKLAMQLPEILCPFWFWFEIVLMTVNVEKLFSSVWG